MMGRQWWTNPSTDWSKGEPAQLLEFLMKVYPSSDEIQRIMNIASQGGKNFPDAARPATGGWLVVLQEAAKSDQVLDLVAAVLHDSGSSYLIPLKEALGAARREAYARFAVNPGFVADSALADEMMDCLQSKPRTRPRRRVGRLQALTQTADGLPPTPSHIMGLLQAMRRTAVIQRGGHAAGTGVLIGPDLLLTAAHVIGLGGDPPDVSNTVAVFDFHIEKGRDQFETGERVAVTAFCCGMPPTNAEKIGTVATWNSPADRLDYAILRLARPIGAEDVSDLGGISTRGYYEILGPAYQDEYKFEPQPTLLICQHPLGEAQVVSYPRGPYELNQLHTRVRYQGNTLQGSSGAPVFDLRGRLVALHHFSAGRRNQGVPISAIVGSLPTELTAAGYPDTSQPPVAGPSPAGTSTLLDPYGVGRISEQPLVDRSFLRDRLRKMAQADGARELFIEGGRRSGISTSYQLLSYVALHSPQVAELRQAAPAGLRAYKIDLNEYSSGPVADRSGKIASVLNRWFGGGGSQADTLAQDAREITAFKQDWWSLLQGSDRQWWIFVDSIDDVTALGGGVDELIQALVDLADDVQIPLRVVLGGRVASSIGGERWQHFPRDDILPISEQHISEWVRDQWDGRSPPPDEGRLEACLRKTFGDPYQSPRPDQLPLLLRALFACLEEGP
jgi:hypothetical protein